MFNVVFYSLFRSIKLLLLTTIEPYYWGTIAYINFKYYDRSVYRVALSSMVASSPTWLLNQAIH